MNYDKSPGSRLFDIFNIIAMLIISFVMLYPFLYVISVSFSDLKAIRMGLVKLWPVGFDLTAYKICLANPDIWRAYYNTIIYTASGTFITVLLTAITAYPLAIKNFYGKKVITIFFTITMFFGGGLIPTYLLIMGLGFIDKIWAIIIPGALSMWNIIIFRTNFQQLPDSIYESAFVDGARRWTILFRIILPLSKPIIATIALFSMVGFWNSFYNPLIYLNSVSKFPLQVYLRNLLITRSMTMGYIDSAIQAQRGKAEDTSGLLTAIQMATIVISIGPIILVYPFAQKYFVKGMLVGSIKG